MLTANLPIRLMDQHNAGFDKLRATTAYQYLAYRGIVSVLVTTEGTIGCPYIHQEREVQTGYGRNNSEYQNSLKQMKSNENNEEELRIPPGLPYFKHVFSRNHSEYGNR